MSELWAPGETPLRMYGLAIANITLPEGGTFYISGCDTVVRDEDGALTATGDEAYEYTVKPGGTVVASRPNAFVNTGLNITLDRLFALSGPPAAIDHICLSSDNTATTLTSTTFGGTVSIKTFSPAASRTNQTVTAGNTFTQADVAFSIRKVGLLNTATDAGTGVLDIIGGAGVSPFNQTFTIDLTTVSTWSMLMQCQITTSN